MKAHPPIAILKPGTFVDMRGTHVTFTRRDLEQVASSYDAVRDPAPLVVGHPAIDAPAYGWVGRVELVGDELRAHPSEVAPAFAEAVAAGRYRKVSPQLYPPGANANPKPGSWYLQHVGFLGGAAPAIKGLGTVAFSQAAEASAVAIVPPFVSFAAPAGYVVDQQHEPLHARARQLVTDNPGLSIWDAFSRARYESTIVSFAERGNGDASGDAAVLIRARAHRAAHPNLTFWEAFTAVRADPAL